MLWVKENKKKQKRKSFDNKIEELTIKGTSEKDEKECLLNFHNVTIWGSYFVSFLETNTTQSTIDMTMQCDQQ
jgi:hypothetical protein